MPAATPLFEKAMAVDAIAEEWIDSLRAHFQSSFMEWLSGSHYVGAHEATLFESWVATHSTGHGPLLLNYFRACFNLNARLFALLNFMGVQCNGPFLNDRSPLDLKRRIVQAARSSLMCMSSRRQERDAYYAPDLSSTLADSPIPALTFCNLHEAYQLGSTVHHQYLAGALYDKTAHLTVLVESYQNAINDSEAAATALQQALGTSDRQTVPNVDDEFAKFTSHIANCIDAHVTDHPLWREIQLLGANYPVVLGNLERDGLGESALCVKLVNKHALTFSTRRAEWTNPHALWMALPFKPDSSWIVCTPTPQPQDSADKDPWLFAPVSGLHPHVDTDGRVCLGNQAGFGVMLWKTFSVSALAELCCNALHCYEHDSAFWRITSDEEDEEDEEGPFDYCWSCDDAISHEDDAYYSTDDTRPYCRSCFDSLFTWCPYIQEYYLEDEMVIVDFGPHAGRHIYKDALQDYINEYSTPDDEETPDEELAEEAEGPKEEGQEEVADSPAPQGEPTSGNSN